MHMHKNDNLQIFPTPRQDFKSWVNLPKHIQSVVRYATPSHTPKAWSTIYKDDQLSLSGWGNTGLWHAVGSAAHMCTYLTGSEML